MFIFFTPHSFSSSPLLIYSLSSCIISFTPHSFSSLLFTKSSSLILIPLLLIHSQSLLLIHSHLYSSLIILIPYFIFHSSQVPSSFNLFFSTPHTVIFIHFYLLYSSLISLHSSFIFTAKKEKLKRCSASPHCRPAHTGSRRASPGR